MSAKPSTARILRAPFLAVLLCAGCDSGAPGPVLELPPRPTDAPGGTEIARDLRALGFDAREQRVYAEVARGNVPSWLRRLRPVEVTGEIDGREHRVTFWVTPDYLAVGSDTDAFLVPLSPQTAQRIADLVNASLPTPRMVDAVWSAARFRLAPQRIQPQDSIQTLRTTAYYERHNRLIQGQRMLYGVPSDAFVAGHKKDIVLAATLSENPGKVAVYGWHRPDGRPNQPLSTAAADSVVYYHHGIRLVHRRILVDGAGRDLRSVLGDPRLAPLLSDGGTIAEAHYPIPRGEGEPDR